MSDFKDNIVGIGDLFCQSHYLLTKPRPSDSKTLSAYLTKTKAIFNHVADGLGTKISFKPSRTILSDSQSFPSIFGRMFAANMNMSSIAYMELEIRRHKKLPRFESGLFCVGNEALGHGVSYETEVIRPSSSIQTHISLSTRTSLDFMMQSPRIWDKYTKEFMRFAELILMDNNASMKSEYYQPNPSDLRTSKPNSLHL